MRALLALSLALAAPLLPVASPAAAAQAGDAEKQARALAQLVHPLELAVATATEGADRYFVASMVKNPDIAPMEKDYPGIMEVMYRAARPFLVEAERRNAKLAQDKLTALYLKELSVEDMGTLHRFFSSPTGQKIVRGMFDPAGIQHTTEAVAANPEADIKAETLIEGQAQAVGRMVAGMTPEDEKVAAALLRTPAGRNWHAMTPKVQAMMVELVNTDYPDIQAQVNAAMEAAANRVMAMAKN